MPHLHFSCEDEASVFILPGCIYEVPLHRIPTVDESSLFIGTHRKEDFNFRINFHGIAVQQVRLPEPILDRV